MLLLMSLLVCLLLWFRVMLLLCSLLWLNVMLYLLLLVKERGLRMCVQRCDGYPPCPPSSCTNIVYQLRCACGQRPQALY
jgi:hypothetical protein